ncbi:outer membrane beta-barrel protein [Rhizobium sp. TRM96647]|uniref:outer membrane beta-barrel protein n=1 Tax=unclassified Rhizobium TaxID=2613769 RepID=UPI0021E7CCB0|nr:MULTISPECIES: outer membrane beta-barrel protein [unclassified Rhizobium]MCV3735929.1 outer membrane beta-barrel protein [Rhizobium sp. TRM96647]MCV3758409.1 outer membrane beta-barrel protein [Rhizobium sp. TRM96650]
MAYRHDRPDRVRPTAPPHRTAAGALVVAALLGVSPVQAQEAAPSALGTVEPIGSDASLQALGAVATAAPQGASFQTPAPAAPDAIETGAVETAPDAGRQNLPTGSVEGFRNGAIPYSEDPPGIAIGTFTLRPTLEQGIGYERTKTGDQTDTRSFSTTTLRGSLVSDWSRHQLTIDGAGTYERNFTSSDNTEPEVDIGADLRLDLSGETTANLTAGYSLEREDMADPNAISGAAVQSAVQTFSGGARIQRDFGLIRGTLGGTVDRETYGDVELSDGSELSQKDRNTVTGILTARIGYEISPALIPFIEASGGRVRYDEERDSSGYARSGDLYAGRAGLEFDLGEKLRGELGIGFDRQTYDDDRLKAINAFAADGAVDWSPQRGTNVNLGLRTSIEPSTAPGESGYVSYLASSEITQDVRSNLVARLTGSYEWRDFQTASASDQNVYIVGTGLAWNFNRYLALSGDVSYELTTQKNTEDTGVTRAGLGLVLRR